MVTLDEEVYNLIKAKNGKLDLVDIALNFPHLTCDIPSMAVSRLMGAGRVERIELYGNTCAYFVRD